MQNNVVENFQCALTDNVLQRHINLLQIKKSHYLITNTFEPVLNSHPWGMAISDCLIQGQWPYDYNKTCSDTISAEKT